MYELNHEQQAKLSNVLMEYLNANDWKGLFAATDCEEFAQQHTQFYEEVSWEDENLEQDCAEALDFILTKAPANLKVIWEIPGVQTMTSRKDEALEAEIQALIVSADDVSDSRTEMFTHFESEHFLVRPIRQDDAKFIFDHWTQDSDITRYLTWKPHQTIADTNSYIESCIESWEQDSFTWLIETKNDNKIVGSFAARRNSHKLDIGYLLIKELRNKGYMTEVIESFIEAAFKIEGVVRIAAVCDVENLASKRAMEKAGMSYEGLLKRWLVAPNISQIPRDCFCLSVVKTL